MSLRKLLWKPVPKVDPDFLEQLLNNRHRLENVIREHLAAGEYHKIDKIVGQLCGEYAYAVHQPHARNGGLIGLAAAAIALGPVC
jgi:hypothetical protein